MKDELNSNYWNVCTECNGQGKKRRRLQKKVRIGYQKALEEHNKLKGINEIPVKPKGNLYVCNICSGSGLIKSLKIPVIDKENYPNIAIVGGGIGGIALAVACLHRGIPFTLYERDDSFDDRSQGYGLTLQQASKVIEGFGITELKDGIVSTRHVVHSTKGEIIGEWGMRKWMQSNVKTTSKKTNIHIARQSLRFALLEQLGGYNKVNWRHKLIDYKTIDNKVSLCFDVNGKTKNVKADLLVGADGIRSSVRKLLIGESPLNYLGCIVILGICSLDSLKDVNDVLLDNATVFQTANGVERIYMMPYKSDSIMWQLSFPIEESKAKALSAKGTKVLKEEACLRTQWHNPIPQILMATKESLISGYPVYDRDLLDPEMFNNAKNATIIGDAAHPMSPFKGQGANQALLDALSLAKSISRECRLLSNWKDFGIRKSVLEEFELEMIERSSSKVKDSAEAAKFLHSEIALYKGNEPRGRVLKNKKSNT